MTESIPDPTHPPAPVLEKRSRVDRQAVISQIGGVRGLIDSGVPILVFITVNAFASLPPAAWSAVGAGGLLLLVRLVRREALQPAVAGLIGVGIAAFIAGQTGEARNFFLPQLLTTAAYGLGFLISAVVRWPLVGIIAEFFWPTQGLTSSKAWRSHRPLMRVYTWLTLLWASVYLARIAVQGSLYLADEVSLLGTTRLVMGWPLTALEALLTVYLVRRARQRITVPEGSSPPSEG